MNFIKYCLLMILFNINTANALDQADQSAIEDVIENYMNAWNYQGGRGFADGFSEDADFVNIFGKHYSGRAEIEERHVQIIQTFFKDSVLRILNVRLREAQPDLVVALVDWRLEGFRTSSSDLNKPGKTRDGIFTQFFVKANNKWEIIASQNTLIPN